MVAVQMQTRGVLPTLHGANASHQHGAAVILGIFRLRADQSDISQHHRGSPLKMTDANGLAESGKGSSREFTRMNTNRTETCQTFALNSRLFAIIRGQVLPLPIANC